MDIEHLRTFVETVRHGSFSEAARSLSLSQPAISRRIRNLEKELNLKLLSRSGGVFTPTRHGLEFLRFAEDVLDRLSAFHRAVGSETPVRGVLQIAASTTPGEFLLPDILAGFLNQFPEVKASLNTLDSDTVETCVYEGHCDVGFLGRPVQHKTLRQWPIARDEIVLAVWASHPFAQEGEVELERLAGERFVERREGSGTHRTVLRLLDEADASLPKRRVVMEMNSIRSQIAAIQMEQGIGFVSSMALDAYGSKRLRPVRIKGLPLSRLLYMIFDPDRKEPALTAFVKYVRESARKRAIA